MWLASQDGMWTADILPGSPIQGSPTHERWLFTTHGVLLGKRMTRVCL